MLVSELIKFLFVLSMDPGITNEIKDSDYFNKSIQRLEAYESKNLSSKDVIDVLHLTDISGTVDEGGLFLQFVKTEDSGEISRTKIIYLLKGVSPWHKVQIDETWQWLGGCSVSIFAVSNQQIIEVILDKENPIYTVKRNTLFGAKADVTDEGDDFVLVTCESVPGFTPELFESPTLETLDELSRKFPESKELINDLKPKHAAI